MGRQGRTGIVVGCDFVRHGFTGAEALERVAGLWKTVDKRETRLDSPETTAQRPSLLYWRRAQ